MVHLPTSSFSVQSGERSAWVAGILNAKTATAWIAVTIGWIAILLWNVPVFNSYFPFTYIVPVNGIGLAFFLTLRWQGHDQYRAKVTVIHLPLYCALIGENRLTGSIYSKSTIQKVVCLLGIQGGQQVGIRVVTCFQCNHTWPIRDTPQKCPKCGSTKWNKTEKKMFIR